jgi:translation initiation factor 2B subunit (eIF-2B alpha/beta/delta family)
MSRKITLKSIIGDKVSGSSEILESLNNYILQNAEDLTRLKNDLHRTKRKLKGFAGINNYIRRIEPLIDSGDTKKLKFFLNKFRLDKTEAYNKIFNKSKPCLIKYNTILTLSNSRTLLEVYKIWSRENKKLKIIICESRPKNEGVIFAKALAKENIKVKLITDASMSNYITRADAVIVGADLILKNGNVVNKTGSRNAAIICRHFKKPFIVLATKDKFANKKSYKSIQENPDEIFSSSHKNIKVSNYYFEEIEKSLITRIFTD